MGIQSPIRVVGSPIGQKKFLFTKLFYLKTLKVIENKIARIDVNVLDNFWIKHNFLPPAAWQGLGRVNRYRVRSFFEE